VSSLDYVTSHLWVQNWDKYSPGMSDEGFVNSTIPWALSYIASSAAEAARLGKPLVVEEFGLPRDLGSLSPSSPTLRRDIYFSHIFQALTASASSQGVLAGVNFWAFAGGGAPGARGIPATSDQLCKGGPIAGAGSGGTARQTLTGASPNFGSCFSDQGRRASSCPDDTWWATQSAWPLDAPSGLDALLGDPPHESQGWYSVYASDSTMGIISAGNERLAKLMACMSATAAGGAPACAAPTAPHGQVGNLC
jgi:hypothetical protein